MEGVNRQQPPPPVPPRPGSCSWGSNLLLPFLSHAACHQRGHGTPNRYLEGGTGVHVCFGGKCRVGICDSLPLPLESDPSSFSLSLPQWWSPWEPCEGAETYVNGKLGDRVCGAEVR